MSQLIAIDLQRSRPVIALVISGPGEVTAEMTAAVTGGPGPKGDPGDPNLIELGVDPALIFENALV